MNQPSAIWHSAFTVEAGACPLAPQTGNGDLRGCGNPLAGRSNGKRARFGRCRVSATYIATVILVLAQFGFAQTPARGPKSVSSQTTVIEVTGKKHTGTLKSIDSDFITLEQTGTAVKITMFQVLRVDFARVQGRTHAEHAWVLLANGDRMHFTPTAITDDVLSGTYHEEPIRIPLGRVRGIVLQSPETADGQNTVASALATHKGNHDLLLLRNGDRLTGRFQSLSRTHITMGGTGGGKSPLTGIRALAFNPRYISFPKPPGAQRLVSLADGSRITANELTTTADGRLRVEAAYGGVIELPLKSVVSLRVLGGKAISLSDLKPLNYESTPFLGGERDLKRDRNARGGRLTLRGREYAKGIGLHSRSRVTYDLDGKYRSFYALVGIDDAARGRGSVRVAVVVDGERVFYSPEITGKSDPLPLTSIDVAGKQKLTLIVEFGQFADVLDFVDWCDAVVVKK